MTSMKASPDHPVWQKRLLISMDQKLDIILEKLHEDVNPLLVKDSEHLLPKFPLNSVDELKKFCVDLKNDGELYRQFEKKILKIGGSSAENHLSNVLVSTMTNFLGKHLTWDGQRKTEGIKETPYATTILGVILNVHEGATQKKLARSFSEWLRRANDRYKYHLKLGRET